MLDFFAVITKGGLVLWYFQDAAQTLGESIAALNALIKNVILQVSRSISTAASYSGRCTVATRGGFSLLRVLGSNLSIPSLMKLLSATLRCTAVAE